MELTFSYTQQALLQNCCNASPKPAVTSHYTSDTLLLEKSEAAAGCWRSQGLQAWEVTPLTPARESAIDTLQEACCSTASLLNLLLLAADGTHMHLL